MVSALEHLRKKIEASTEKIKAAKLKEQQAKNVRHIFSLGLKHWLIHYAFCELSLPDPMPPVSYGRLHSVSGRNIGDWQVTMLMKRHFFSRQ